MTDTVYESIRAVNWSSLKHLAKSPLEYQWRIDHPEPRKPAFLLGNGIHCRALEPDEFDSRYAEWDMLTAKGDKLTARNGRALEEWTDLHYGAEPLLPAEMEHVKRAGDAVLAHPVAARILKGCRHEEPLTWVDPDTGLACKGRVDSINPSYIVDLKSARDPSPRAFNRAAVDFLYHGQISFYQTGAIASRKLTPRTSPPSETRYDEFTGDPISTPPIQHDDPYYEMPYVIAVAKEPPYDVGVYQFKNEDLAAGRALCLRLMAKLEECIAADWFPGCAPDLQYLDLPSWAPGLSTHDDNEEW